MLYPLKMLPYFRHGEETPWGGRALGDTFGKPIPDDRTGESLEISALPGRECRHNLKYWSLQEYLGLGDSASSYLDGRRTTYGHGADGEKFIEVYDNTPFDDRSEYVFTGLRKTAGVDFDAFREKFGEDLWEVFGDRRGELEEFFRSGALLEDARGIRLSESGIDISNKIMAVFV